MKRSIVVFAPNIVNYSFDQNIIFLAGSIEMNSAANWQEEITKELLKIPNLIILNPRRKQWNKSWKQVKENTKFREQVDWELKAQEGAELILMYFDPNTKSPITLLELGLFARSRKLAVCCPNGFYRKGNVDIVCETYDIPQFNSLGGLVDYVKDKREHEWKAYLDLFNE